MILRWAGATSVVALAFASGAAWGAETPESRFSEAREAMKRGDTDRACKEFENLQALEATFGTLTNLAECAQLRGDWKESFRLLQQARALAGPSRAAYISERIAEVSPHVGFLALPASAQNVHIDGIAEPFLHDAGQTVVVTPGRHVVGFVSEGMTREESCEVNARETRECPAKSAELSAKEKGKRRPTTGPLLTGLGLGLIGVGLGFGGYALLQRSAADRCPMISGTRQCADTETLDRVNSGKIAAYIATGAVIGGVAVGGLGVTVWVSGRATAPQSAGLSLSGGF